MFNQELRLKGLLRKLCAKKQQYLRSGLKLQALASDLGFMSWSCWVTLGKWQMLSGSVLSLCEWGQNPPPGACDENGRIHIKLSAPCLAYSNQTIKITIMSIMQLYGSSHFWSVQSLIRVWLFVNPWTTAHQTSLSITNSRSLLKLMSFESVMSSNYLILYRLLLLLPSIFSSFYLASQQSPGIWCDSPRPWSIRSNNRYIFLDSIVYHLTGGRV